SRTWFSEPRSNPQPEDVPLQLVAADGGQVAEVRVDRGRVGDHVGGADAEANAEVVAVEVEQAERGFGVGHESALPDVAERELAADLEDVVVLVAHLAQLRVADDDRQVLAEIAAVVQLQVADVPVVVARAAVAGKRV